MPDVLELAKRRGFFWPAFEAYQGCAGFYEYGPVGSLLKLRVEGMIRDHFLMEEGCLLFDAPVLTIEAPWIASGHIQSFTDMTVDCTQCGEAYRADHLLEGVPAGLGIADIQELLAKGGAACPKCKGRLGRVYDYNLMFKTLIGPGKNKVAGVLRPETATSTYLAFKRLFEVGRKSLPLGVLQIGKSFRNEISPRKAIIRLREFHQAEAQFFLEPGTEKHPRFREVDGMDVAVLAKQEQKKGLPPQRMKIRDVAREKRASQWIAYHLAKAVALFERMGIDPTKLRLRQHLDTERSFYSKDTWDVEFVSAQFGVVELVGVADRTDYDLKRQAQVSKQDFSVQTPDGKKFIPHVVEVAFGVDRPVYCVLESALLQDGDRVYLRLPPAVAPYQIAVFPLVKKDRLPERAAEVFRLLKEAGFYTLYDEGFIGKVYYRQDEIGTRFAVTVDYDTLEKGDVTVRDRDNQQQVRVDIKGLVGVMQGLFAGRLTLAHAGRPVEKKG